MLALKAEEFGLGLGRFFELGRAGELIEPELRDLWLIWGKDLTEADILDYEALAPGSHVRR